MPGWFGLAKKNEVHQWPESCLGSPGKKRIDVSQELDLVQKKSLKRNIIKEKQHETKPVDTWVVRNDFPHVLCASTGTAAGGRSKAP